MAKPNYERLEKYFEDRYPNIKEENLTKENLRDFLNEILRKERERYGIEKTRGIEGYVRKESTFKEGRIGRYFIESSIENWRKEKIKLIIGSESLSNVKDIERDVVKEEVEPDFIHLKEDVLSKGEYRKENLMENVLKELGASEKSKNTLRPFLRDRNYDLTTIKTHLYRVGDRAELGIWSPEKKGFLTHFPVSRTFVPSVEEVKETYVPIGAIIEQLMEEGLSREEAELQARYL